MCFNSDQFLGVMAWKNLLHVVPHEEGRHRRKGIPFAREVARRARNRQDEEILGLEFAPRLKAGDSDLAFFAIQCRLPGCRHADEPGCAVKEALNAGTLSWEQVRKA